MKCEKECTRTPCSRQHPCPRQCWEDCGKCEFPMYKIKLPCGHVAERVAWSVRLYAPFHILSIDDASYSHELADLSSVKCRVPVLKRLPTCEHSATIGCSEDPATVVCTSVCSGQLGCCARPCRSKCSECQGITKAAMATDAPVTGRIPRSHHRSHPCERLLYCQHLCGLACSKNHECNTKCSQKCRQTCSHSSCPAPCWKPCAPCMEPCEWICQHFSCSVLCGSVSVIHIARIHNYV